MRGKNLGQISFLFDYGKEDVISWPNTKSLISGNFKQSSKQGKRDEQKSYVLEYEIILEPLQPGPWCSYYKEQG